MAAVLQWWNVLLRLLDYSIACMGVCHLNASYEETGILEMRSLQCQSQASYGITRLELPKMLKKTLDDGNFSLVSCSPAAASVVMADLLNQQEQYTLIQDEGAFFSRIDG